MEARVKVFEQRMEKQIAEKEGLLNDVEQIRDLRLSPMKHFRDRVVETRDLSLQYKASEKPVFEGLTFEIRNGERVFLQGKNGCGKTSLIKAILAQAEEGEKKEQNFSIDGTLLTAPHLKISYINQDTSHLHGDLRMHAFENGVDYSLFLAVLRQLALEQAQFEKNIEDFSEGQKKKVLIATSLLTPAHLYIWDEPLNYVDVFSRMQLEKLISEYQPTMLIVEHDVRFREKMATKVVEL
ncbi:MAG: ABC-F family ATP-binding cassette domain-containing protein [Clostridiales bacterium]|nr:ABC-F family ATP-binding cassette domain-containing protein [Clostridiales bacterium]